MVKIGAVVFVLIWKGVDMINTIVNDIKELKKPCERITSYEETQVIIKDLEDTLKQYPQGVGLSANQIGYHKKVAIIRAGGHEINLINPTILEKRDKIVMKEGCLSFGNIAVITDRYNYIKIMNNGLQFEFMYDIAIIIQHEIDHLNGLTMFDRKHKNV